MKYTDSHEWVVLEGSVAIMGISEHAQEELGEIVYIELPEKGKTFRAGDEIVILESTKAAADIYAPISGTVIEVNEAVKKSPQLLNSSPEKEGWLLKIAVADPSELDTLLNSQQYHHLIS